MAHYLFQKSLLTVIDDKIYFNICRTYCESDFEYKGYENGSFRNLRMDSWRISVTVLSVGGIRFDTICHSTIVYQNW